MPSAAAHFALASELEKLLQLREDSFVYGCILPDIISTAPPKQPHFNPGHRPGRKPVYPNYISVPDPHYHKHGTHCLVPDLERFWRESELDGYLQLGYAAHLMLDWYFLEEFCPQCVSGFLTEQIFSRDKIYEDYSRLNPLLVKHFQLNVDYLTHIIDQEYFNIPIDDEDYRRNRTWISNLADQPPARYIDFYEFVDFITNSARRITEDPQFRALASSLKH